MDLVNTIDVPDVFATTTRIEDAGGGCIRIYNCVVKDGALVPVGNSVVFPIACVLGLAEAARDFASRLSLLAMRGEPVH